MRRFVVLVAAVAAVVGAQASPAAAQRRFPASAFVGRPIASIVLLVEGRATTDPSLSALLETKVGSPLAMRDVRESLTHLFDLGRFEGVDVLADDAPDGRVVLTYDLRPLHAVTDIEFSGDVGLPADDLRRVIVDRFTKSPPAGRADAASRTLEQYLSRRGYLTATVIPSVDVRHDPDRTILVFNVAAGVRARVGRVQITGADTGDPQRVAERLGLRAGAPFDFNAFDERVSQFARSLRTGGYYEATVDPKVEPQPNNTIVDVSVDIRRGPVVKVAFEGEQLPRNRIADLVPIEREGSADEDLLEDSDIRIRDYLLEQGYPKAQVSHRRDVNDGTEAITFTVKRGSRYIVDRIEISGNASIPVEKLRELVSIRRGEPFVERKLTAATAAIKLAYLQQGFTAVAVDAANSETPPATPAEDGRINVRIVIREGVQTRVGAITIEGNTTLSARQLLAATRVRTGDVFFEPAVAADKEAVLLHYLNAGFASATVAVETPLSADRRRVDLAYHVVENQQVLVDQIIIVGNTKTSEKTIRQQLLVAPGKPLGYDDLIETQRRLSALGLFRRVRVTEMPHGTEPRHDILITVEEANRTSLAYGAGLEVTPLTVPGPGGIAEQQYKVAPRGSFEIGRRSLWGKNQSVNLFTRFAFRPKGQAVESESSQYGINEYRVVGTYRSMNPFNSKIEFATNAYFEQAVRSTFNFRRRGLGADALRQMSRNVRLSLRYLLGRTELLDADQIPPDLQLDIDRLFPQVRLSVVTAALYRDTRNDPLEPSRGMLLAEDGDLALKALGSQVGFAKVFFQAFAFRTLPGSRKIVFASAARLGLARGLREQVEGVFVEPDLPASERFFAGGSTTVRGFAPDRLGTKQTITSQGFPRGGNSVLILNAELRIPVWRDFGMVGFMDAGNVFARVSDLDLTELRFSPGLGIRYHSPIGPIRFDVGFKLNRQELSPGRFEALTAFHVSVGHAF
jgi:outer membrane protein assembly factor BamA